MVIASDSTAAKKALAMYLLSDVLLGADINSRSWPCSRDHSYYIVSKRYTPFNHKLLFKSYIFWISVILNVLIVLVLLRGNWDEATGPTSKKCSKLCGNGVEIWGRRIWRSFSTTPSQLHDSEVEYSHHTAWRLLLLLRLHVQKKNCQNSTGPKCQLSWLSDSWDIYIRL